MIQIAIMGLGTVGTGVARVVEENAQQIQRKLGEPLQVKTVLARPRSQARTACRANM